jgi:hypothetical protein
MVIHRVLFRVTASLMVLGSLAACGGEPAPAAQAPAATQAPAAQAPAATQAPEAQAPTADTAAAAPKNDGEPAGADAGTAATSGTYVADLGFRPDANGFGFPNYGGQGEVNLTPNDVRRMFGDQACSSIEGDQCILTPPGAQWLEQISAAMNGVHCEGMAVLSNLF